MPLTKAKLEKFVRIRNKSGMASNLQFAFDASAAGFNVDDLGDCTKQDFDYVWTTPFGKLIESGGVLRIEP